MLRFPLPVIAAVNGPAVGLGCSLAVLSDIVLMSETALPGRPARRGRAWSPGDGGAAFWPLLTPILRSREYLYTGDRIPRGDRGRARPRHPHHRARRPADGGARARRAARRAAARAPCRAPSGCVNMHLSQALERRGAGRLRGRGGRPCSPTSTATGCSRAARARSPARGDRPADDRPRRLPRRGARRGAGRHVPADWRAAQTGVSDDEFVGFQKDWFQQLRERGLRRAALAGGVGRRHVRRRAGRALPGAGRPRRAPAGAGVRVDPPRGVDAARGRHRRAAPAPPARPSSTARSGARASPSPRPAPTWPALRDDRPPRTGDGYVVNGQKLWASGALHADWCLLLARTDPDAPKRARHLLLPAWTCARRASTCGPIRKATGDSHFCEMFLDDVVIPASNLVGRRERRLAGGAGDPRRRARA